MIAETLWPEKVQFALTAALLALAVLLGGGQGGLGDTLLQLHALVLLAWVLATRESNRAQLFSWRSPAWLVVLVLLLPLVQLLPWLGLQPLWVERALWGLLPAIAVFLSGLTLSRERQRLLLTLLLALGFLSLLLGLMQRADGPDSSLRLYANTNASEAVGFFANRNHLAALLVACLPVSLAAVALSIAERRAGKSVGLLKITVTIGLAVVLILGIALTRSRAGLLLGLLGLVLSVPMLLALRRRRAVRRAYGIIVALAVLLTVQFAFLGILQRLQADPLGDQRWRIARITIEAAQAQSAIGAGLGSFRQVFQSFDTREPGPEIINHAHNDYLQLWLEGGWPFIVLATVFIAYLLWRTAGAWRTAEGRHSLLAKAASISILLLLLHSTADYPLRTTSNQAVFALLLAVLLSWRDPAAANPQVRSSHRTPENYKDSNR